MPDYDIEQAAEKAMQAWLRSKSIAWVQPKDGIGVDRIYCGIENREAWTDEGEESSIIRLPCIICYSPDFTPVLPNFHGNWNGDLTVEVRSNCDDTTGKEHAQRVRGIYEFLYTTTIAKDLSGAIEEFYVAKVAPGPRGYSVVDDSWRTKMVFSLFSAAAIHIDG